MKRNSPPVQPSTATVDDLRAQLDSIAAALAIETEREKAERIAAAERARADREAAVYAQRTAALSSAASATKAAVNELLRLDAGVFAQLDAAVQALGQAGATPAYSTAAVIGLRQQLTGCLARLADLDPVLVGKPAPMPEHDVQLLEAARAMGKAIGDFEATQKLQSNRSHMTAYSSDDFVRVLQSHANGARAAARRIAALGGSAPNLPHAMQEYLSLEVHA